MADSQSSFSGGNSTDTEEIVIHYMAYGMIVAGLASLTKQLVGSAACYGRYTPTDGGVGRLLLPIVPAKIAWFMQELPVFALPVLMIFFSEAKRLNSYPNVICLCMVIVHYFNRTFIFSLGIRGKPTPMLTFIAAILFCSYNGYMQGRYQTQYAVYQPDWVYSPIFITGCCLFVIGMAINIHSDNILRNLRKPGETGYKIPRGGMFNYISGANFFGESVEWIGYALASWNLPAFAFALFAVSNIGPRAYHHHQYYKEKFEDYPPERKAFIPFLL